MTFVHQMIERKCISSDSACIKGTIYQCKIDGKKEYIFILFEIVVSTILDENLLNIIVTSPIKMSGFSR